MKDAQNVMGWVEIIKDSPKGLLRMGIVLSVMEKGI